MAEINEKVVVDTSKAVAELGELQTASKKADTALDELAEQAQAVDREDVSIPVETPGAEQAATELDHVDQKARAMGEGAQVGTQHVSDLAGMFGDAGGQASAFGQAIEGAGGIVESFAGQLGLSEQAAGKLSSAIGLVAVGVAAAAAAWAVYKQDAANAKRGMDETRDALEQVYDKLREGDAMAAAQTFVDTMGDKIEKFRGFLGDQVSKADIAGVIFGDPNSIDRVSTAIDDLDGKSKLLAQGALSELTQAWGDAKDAVQSNIDLQSQVEGFFGALTTGANNAATAAGGVKTAWEQAHDAAVAAHEMENIRLYNARQAGTPSTYRPGTESVVVNNYPPANTPLAVEQAQTRWTATQGYS